MMRTRMDCWTLLGFAAALVAAMLGDAATARAGGPWKMEYRPESEERYRLVNEDATELVLSTSPRRHSSQVAKIVRRQTGKASKAGEMPLVETIEHIQARYEVPSVGNFQYDSANPPIEQASAGGFVSTRRETLAAMVGASWTRFLDREGHVLRVEGLDELVDRAPSEEGRKELARYYTNQRVLGAPELEREWLPREPTERGDTWIRRLALGGDSMAVTVERRYRLEGTVMKGPKELVKISLVDQAPSLELGATVGLSVEESLLRVTESKGEMLFDPQAGKIVKSEIRTTVKGKVQLPISTDGKKVNKSSSVLIVEHYSLRELLP